MSVQRRQRGLFKVRPGLLQPPAFNLPDRAACIRICSPDAEKGGRPLQCDTGKHLRRRSANPGLRDDDI